MSRVRFVIVMDWPDFEQGQNLWAKRTRTPPARRIIQWMCKVLGRKYGAKVTLTECHIDGA